MAAKRTLLDDIFRAIESQDLQQLDKAIKASQAAAERSWLGALMKNGAHASWTKAVRHGRTAIGEIIEKQWLAGLEHVAPMTNLNMACGAPIPIIGSRRVQTPASKCVKLRWSNGVAVVAGGTEERLRQEALWLACFNSDEKSTEALLLAGARPMPPKPMMGRTLSSLFAAGPSPLHAAVDARSAECVEALVKRGANGWGLVQPGIKHPIELALPNAHQEHDPSWKIASLLLPDDASCRRLTLPNNDQRRSPLMEILAHPELLARAIAFKSLKEDGAEFLLRLASIDNPEAYGKRNRDVDGKLWTFYANMEDPYIRNMEFKDRLRKKFDDEWNLLPEDKAVPRPSSEGLKESPGVDSAKPHEQEGLAGKKLGNAQAGEASDFNAPSDHAAAREAIERCLSEAAAVSAAVESLAEAMDSMSGAVDGLAESEAGSGDVELMARAAKAMEVAREAMRQATSARSRFADLQSLAEAPKRAAQSRKR